MGEILEASRGTGAYDAIVAFSGGKDSSYTLKLLVEDYGLNCLAVTIDNGFISEGAFKNCRTITAKRVIVKSGVCPFESSGDLVEFYHLDSVFEFDSGYHLCQVIESA